MPRNDILMHSRTGGPPGGTCGQRTTISLQVSQNEKFSLSLSPHCSDPSGTHDSPVSLVVSSSTGWMVKWKYSGLILTYSELLKVNIISTYFTLGMGHKSCSHIVSKFVHVDPTVVVLYFLIQFPSWFKTSVINVHVSVLASWWQVQTRKEDCF